MTVYADDVNYWRTSRTAPDVWLQRAAREIERIGGQVLASGFIREHAGGRAAFLLKFTLEGHQFRIAFPVLPPRKPTEANWRAAHIQTATALFHSVKARCVEARMHGARAAFHRWLVLPNGRAAEELSDTELVRVLPEVFGGLPLPPPDDEQTPPH